MKKDDTLLVVKDIRNEFILESEELEEYVAKRRKTVHAAIVYGLVAILTAVSAFGITRIVKTGSFGQNPGNLPGTTPSVTPIATQAASEPKTPVRGILGKNEAGKDRADAPIKDIEYRVGMVEISSDSLKNALIYNL